MKEKVVIFSGAGASKAVNREQFPTTIEFFERLPESISSRPLFQIILRAVRAEFQTETVDIEQVLWALEELRGLMAAIQKRSGIVPRLLRDKLFETLFNGESTGHLVPRAGQIVGLIDDLVSDINKVVFEFYGYIPSKDELERNWIFLLSELRRRGAQVEIFTTNYDVSVETAIEVSHDGISERSYLGLTAGRHKRLDLSNWAEETEFHEIFLTKLHGSIDWKRRGDDIYVSDPLFTGDHQRQAIIYPGFKGDTDQVFFRIFNQYLASRITQADVCVFIGFAFRDDHLNEIFRDTFDRDKSVLIINPDQGVKFPAKRAKVVKLSAGFDESASLAVREVLRR